MIPGVGDGKQIFRNFFMKRKNCLEVSFWKSKNITVFSKIITAIKIMIVQNSITEKSAKGFNPLFYAGMLMVMNDVINNFEEEK